MPGRLASNTHTRGYQNKPAYQVVSESSGGQQVLASADDWELAVHSFQVLCEKHREDTITLRQGARVIMQRKVLMAKFECRQCGQLTFRDVHNAAVMSKPCRGCSAPPGALARIGG
ncbi:MAG: hypothetical protein AAFY73_14740 [Pseudomonadota bacterium]